MEKPARKETPARVVEDIGRRIREIREARGLTQQEMAIELDCSVKHLQRLEGGRNMHIDTLVKLALKLRVPTRSLLDPPRSRSKRAPGRPRKDPG